MSERTNVEIKLTVSDTYDYEDIKTRISSIDYTTSLGTNAAWSKLDLIVNNTDYINMHTLLHGNSLQLINQKIPASALEQLRIKFAAEALIVKNGVTYPLVIPDSLQQTGLAVPAAYTISAGESKSIWLSLDLSKSVVYDASNQTYTFKPRFRTFDPKVCGNIDGYIKPDNAKPYITIYTETDDSQNNTAKFEVSTIPYAGGYFKLVGIPAGKYQVKLESANGTFSNQILNDVASLNGITNGVGTITLQK